ncbi:MAG: yloV, partial [Clostridia bacterium]|nr:yloV [Clostridia bacterium]
MINGSMYRDMVVSAANAIENVKEEINSLNIFPVPDGDTGINMSLTMQSAKRNLVDFDGGLSECSEKVSSALLRGGRGNSGVILSLFFRGIAKEFKGKNEADSYTVAKAFKSGVESAYKAVRHPTEGTILTVMRLSAETAVDNAELYADDIHGFFNEILEAAVETLKKTPDML